MAFKDATMRNAFPKREEEKKVKANNNKSSLFVERKNEVQKRCESIIRLYVDEITDGTNPVNPIKTILVICDKTRDLDFTFGNSQKLVNMMAKYMFLGTYSDEIKRSRFYPCHCPMDGVMIDFIKKGFLKYSELNSFKDSTEYKDFFKLRWDSAWSRLTYENGVPKPYDCFQRCIRKICKIIGNEIIPIEVDYLYWDN